MVPIGPVSAKQFISLFPSATETNLTKLTGGSQSLIAKAIAFADTEDCKSLHY
jgi:hypothetical protein